ncbi:iron transporter [Pokkaliibacter plantistimulans]|uniref:Probable Fe(2+)-trafficking protein n=1 Tax=Pokkaliibacter plantistimulans TaxID=1635171 RepID=A0ABX5M2A5_9GAMM|nr:oxidative damage protection protein [Pokkaliibacter plantistimulans]PXF31648.1 iron transporter [Pokkaliibacter plantistimulans]
MTRTVFCRKYQKDMDGMERPPFPGPKGQDLYEHISRQAWQDWLAHQTMLINEKRLNMMDMQSRKLLQEEMDKFFAGEDVTKIEGYVPPSEK